MEPQPQPQPELSQVPAKGNTKKREAPPKIETEEVAQIFKDITGKIWPVETRGDIPSGEIFFRAEDVAIAFICDVRCFSSKQFKEGSDYEIFEIDSKHQQFLTAPGLIKAFDYMAMIDRNTGEIFVKNQPRT